MGPAVDPGAGKAPTIHEEDSRTRGTAMKIYPYYIVEWSEGRLQAPPQYRHTPVGRMFERGQIGGRRVVEREAGTAEEALELWRRNRDKQSIEVFLVRAPNSPRQRVQPERLADSEYFGDHEHTT